jgi:hypothetical protein
VLGKIITSIKEDIFDLDEDFIQKCDVSGNVNKLIQFYSVNFEILSKHEPDETFRTRTKQMLQKNYCSYTR